MNAIGSKRPPRYGSPHRVVVRAKIVLLAAEGLHNDEIAARLDTPRQIVSKWRKQGANLPWYEKPHHEQDSPTHKVCDAWLE